MILKLFATTKELRHKFKTKQKGFQCIGLRKFPLSTKEITDELHRAKRIASDFDEETKELEVNSQTQDTQNMLLKTLSGPLTEGKMIL